MIIVSDALPSCFPETDLIKHAPWLETVKRDLVLFILLVISTRLFITLIEDGKGTPRLKFKYPN
jgi:hypothetical protein